MPKDQVIKTCGELEVKLHAVPAVLEETAHKAFRSDGNNYFKESGLV